MLRLGLFDNFKPENNRTILLSGDGRDMGTLVALLDPVLSGRQESVTLHDRISVTPNHPVKIFAVRSLPEKPTTGEFFLLCSADLSLEIRDKIEPLMNAQDGHQYFDLAHKAGTLMVSVGEYDDSWWTTHG
jgi:hypothetical protein